MADDPGKAPPDEAATVLRADAPDVADADAPDESEAGEERTVLFDGAAPENTAGEAATVAIDNRAAGDRAAEEVRRSRALDSDAPTEYEGAPKEQEEERPPELPPGTILFGEYEVGDRIGSGGMGEVYRARHRRLGEDRAIKMIRPIYTADPAAARLFDREARSLLKIHHPAVVRCHDMLSDDTGRVYLVMEFVEGHSLADRLQDGPLNRKQLEELAARLASGLTAAHAMDVVHRDLSPDNVVLPGGSFSTAKLIDFGIAKEVKSSETTILDGFKGKVLYASPEQIGYFNGEVDRRSDYFSLGLVLATAALGEPLPMGGSLIQAVDARRETVTLPREIPEPIRRMIQPLLEVDPASRPDSLDALMPRRPDAAAVAHRSDAGGRGLAALLGGLGAVAATAGAIWIWQSQGTPEAPEAPTPALERETPAPPVAVVAPAPEPAVVEPEPPAPEPVAKVVSPPAPKPKGPSASDRAASLRQELRIEGLMAGARAALAEGRLSSPPGDNAVEKLEAVLKLDPGNAEARSSLNAVGGRYLEMADVAIASGEVEAAEGYVAKAAKLAPAHPALASTRAALAGAR